MKLFVVEPLGTGGMIHYAYQLCTALANQGADVTLVTAKDYELDAFPHNFAVEKRMQLWPMFDPSSSQLQSGRLERTWRKIRWTVRRGWRALRLIWGWVQLTNYLLQQQPDLIQFGKINFPFEALFLAQLRRKGLILSQICHEFELRERKGGPLTNLANRLYAGVYDNFSFIFFHGESNRQRFLSLFQIPPERTHIIPHGNEAIFPVSTNGAQTKEMLKQRYGLTPNEPVVLFFGTLTPSKGLPDLLQAFAIVRQSSRARLLVAGFPTKHIDMTELNDMVTNLGLAESITFDPRYIPIKEVGPVMELATVAVYPYRNSTQSGALQVAYAFGRPVVATRVGGLPEAVDEGQSGLLVPPEEPQALATAISKIINNPQLAAEMGAYARRLSETRYSWQPIADQILAVYQNVLEKEPRPV
ncbi:MAG: glycosyltransferase family 4 protein [Anaerolineae bacterium]|nr:glycosyltransferase family 4 protein [Anaerolineae bacterium]